MDKSNKKQMRIKWTFPEEESVEQGGLARPTGPHDGEELSRSDHSAYCNTKLWEEGERGSGGERVPWPVNKFASAEVLHLST